METTFTAKQFKKFMVECQQKFLEKCKLSNNRKENTEEDRKLAESYFPTKNLLKYGYYHYNHRNGFYKWTKNK